MLVSQKKLIFFLTIDLIILLVFIWLVTCPLMGKIKTASNKYLSNQETLANLGWKESLTKELEKEYQENQNDLSALEGVFLKTEEAVGFISTLERIAEQTGNVFEIKTASSFTPSAEEESFLAFRISLWGDFSGLLSFLANLENNPYPPYRLIEIDSLTIKKATGQGLSKTAPSLKAGDLETVLGIKIYTQ